MSGQAFASGALSSLLVQQLDSESLAIPPRSGPEVLDGSLGPVDRRYGMRTQYPMIGIVVCIVPFLLQLYERLGASDNG